MKNRKKDSIRRSAFYRSISVWTSVWVLLVCFSLPGLCREESSPASILLKAHEEGRAIPLLSRLLPNLDTASAYKIQRRLVYLKGTKIVGYKAGLTSNAGMKRFGLDEPVTGVLPASGYRPDGATVSAEELRAGKLMLETELGFRIQKRIRRTPANVTELKRYIKYVLPVIELPDLGFADMKRLKGTDIIAANVGAAGFIAGSRVLIADLVPDDVRVTLSRDGNQVNQGKGDDVLHGQWEAALWLVNHVINRGGILKKGQIIITGALGEMIPAVPGNYVADFGTLGKITFTVR